VVLAGEGAWPECPLAVPGSVAEAGPQKVKATPRMRMAGRCACGVVVGAGEGGVRSLRAVAARVGQNVKGGGMGWQAASRHCHRLVAVYVLNQRVRMVI